MSNRHQRRAQAATVRTAKTRKVFDYKQTKFWAERGLINTVHEETGEYKQCSVREWLLRARALSRQAWAEKYPDEREKLITLVENMIRVAKQAKGQGDPYSREGVAEAVRRLPTQVLVPDITYSYKGKQEKAPAGAGLILPGDPNFK
jgi:hypothetical protein